MIYLVALVFVIPAAIVLCVVVAGARAERARQYAARQAIVREQAEGMQRIMGEMVAEQRRR